MDTPKRRSGKGPRPGAGPVLCFAGIARRGTEVMARSRAMPERVYKPHPVAGESASGPPTALQLVAARPCTAPGHEVRALWIDPSSHPPAWSGGRRRALTPRIFCHGEGVL